MKLSRNLCIYLVFKFLFSFNCFISDAETLINVSHSMHVCRMYIVKCYRLCKSIKPNIKQLIAIH